jgi:hypothetical protein
MNIEPVVNSLPPPPNRLAFNFPAIRYYLEGNDKSGISVKIEASKGVRPIVFIKPVSTLGSATLPISQRGEHGKQIVLEGDLTDDIMTALTSGANVSDFPFFVMKPDKNGWIRLEQHLTEEPPRLVPHLRLWMPKISEAVAKEATPASPVDVRPLIAPFVDRLTECDTIVRNYRSERRMGRPPREVQEAQNILSSFKRLATGAPAEQQQAA